MAELVSATPINIEAPTECTFRFARFAAYGSTAYQKGQEAGFTLAEGLSMERRGAGRIVNSLAQQREIDERVEREVAARVAASTKQAAPAITK